MVSHFSNLVVEDSDGKYYCPDKASEHNRVLEIHFFSGHSLMVVEEEREDGTYKVKQLYVPNENIEYEYVGMEALVASKIELGRIIVDMEGNEVND